MKIEIRAVEDEGRSLGPILATIKNEVVTGPLAAVVREYLKGIDPVLSKDADLGDPISLERAFTNGYLVASVEKG